MEQLEVNRAEIAQSGMATTAIIEPLDVEENVGLSLLSGTIGAMVHQLCFQGSKKALNRGVVIAVTGAAHAYLDEVTLQEGLIIFACVLAAPVGLSDSASMAIVINANLVGTDWILGNTIPGTSILLQFANDSLGGFASCNTYNASYTSTLAAGPTNDISVGPINSSQQACTPEILAQEQAYLTSLQSATSYTISGTTLTLTTVNGPLLFNAAVATPYATQ